MLLTSSPSRLQRNLDLLTAFCSDWKLEINIVKSKAMVFNSNSKSFLIYFTINGSNIETVSKFCYLGISLNFYGKFKLASSILVEKARKALFKIKTTMGYHSQCKTLEKLFDAIVLPILLYGSESGVLNPP